jgi:hypothetical protein
MPSSWQLRGILICLLALHLDICFALMSFGVFNFIPQMQGYQVCSHKLQTCLNSNYIFCMHKKDQ